VSHLSYVRQKNRDHGVPLSELSLAVTDHDRERAEDVVAELERLGVFRDSGVSEGGAERPAAELVEPAEAVEPNPVDPPPGDPPSRQSRRGQVTDIWGNPLGSRSFRRKR
jgi:hypothetical protein